MLNFLNPFYKNSKVMNVSKGKFKHTNHAFIQMMIAKRYQDTYQHMIVVLPNLYEAQKYYDALSQLIGDENCLFYPSDQTLTSLMALGSPEFKNERLYTLRTLLDHKKYYVVVTTQEGVLTRQLSPIDYEKSVLTLKPGDQYPLNELTKKLIYDGYQFNYTVERPGEFSIRGSIVDIFTHDHQYPFRLDFFGDEIEYIKTFDVISQKSIQNESVITIAPLHELFFTDKQKLDAMEKINQYFESFELSEKELGKFNQDMIYLEERKKLDTLTPYLKFFNEATTTLLDFAVRYQLFLVEPSKMLINEQTTISDLKTYSETMEGSVYSELTNRAPLNYLMEKDSIEIEIFNQPSISYEDLSVIEVDPLFGYLEQLVIFMNQYAGYKFVFALNQKVSYERLKAFLDDQHIAYDEDEWKKENCLIVLEEGLGSFIDLKEKLILLSEDIIFHSKKRNRIRYRSVINQSVKIRDVSELQNGDYVVHYDFGIGQYIGLKTMSLSGDKRDYLHIIYDNQEALYVPTDQIELVLKYRSHDDLTPKLSKLSSKQWSKTKASVRKKIKDLSDRLLKLYAYRNQAQGFSFSPDSELLEQFENDFLYEETPDQKKAINLVKQDMESSKPMDRLVAGDVGFGKTEVALRAAFKAVLDAKQVAYLVPTTVLARQHYYTFKERFEKYGSSVALLSRFVSKKEQNETLEKLKKGYIDVVIGTHRLLSEDVKFRDLGLFIIDEEQRFGVEHKEKIKEIKVHVDTLTLSATPIPRTLQMAMYGLKDLSMIDTPPLNRYPVQTYVVERQDALIKEAIERELARAGQVFYLFNHTDRMESMVLKLNKLVPQARIAFAHGKMSKQKLEDVLESFIEKEFDILVSTTIIETGVDIPNTNTLIIHEADKLGLAQLYQLRGRVGRSDRIAYAYLMFDAYKNINDEARKRLSVIEDFTDLGSGFKIALRDLNIRGAGDLLGDEQSGFIDSVGMDLYMKLLNEVMEGITEEPPKKEVVDQVFSQRHIPDTYIQHDPVRIEIHKRISALDSIEALENLKLELIDRFGEMDIDVLIYMYEKLFKKLGSKIGIEKTVQQKDSVKLMLSLEKSETLDGMKLLYVASRFKTKVTLATFKGHVEINILTRDIDKHWLYIACELLEAYLTFEGEYKS